MRPTNEKNPSFIIGNGWRDCDISEDSVYRIETNSPNIFYKGTWFHGDWENGVWFDGFWIRGFWSSGYWLNGIWKFGYWHNGLCYPDEVYIDIKISPKTYFKPKRTLSLNYATYKQ